MVRPPDHFVAVDWSGRATGERPHLWLAEVAGAGGGPGRLWNASRAQAADALLALAGEDVVIGLDFSFSMPAWFLHEQCIKSVDDLWRDGARLERWLADCAPPFWGKPGRRRPSAPGDRDPLRVTERAAGRPQPKSVFQIGGAGSVGTGSLRGFPLLDRLRRAGFSIWPFDPPTRPLVVEVWPRHHTVPPIVKSQAAARAAYSGIPPNWRPLTDATENAFDAAVAALGMAARAHEFTLLPHITDPTIGLEGWIWGVPLPPGIACKPWP